MPNMEFRRESAQKSPSLWAATISIAAICIAFGAFAQAPGAAPPAAPAAPGAPAAPAGDNAARARAAALAAKANIDITEAWTRASGSAAAAPVYLHIVSAKDPDKLLGIEVAAAEKVELRDDSQAGGRSVPIPVIDIPPGGTVNFAPGGRYLNLVGLKAPLKEGESFLITLKFDKAGTSSTSVKVLGAGATGLPASVGARRGDTTSGVSQR
jgi:copper(I)-binding protein